MRSEDNKSAKRIRRVLQTYSQQVQKLPGIDSPAALDTLIFQIIESVRRIRYIQTVASRPIAPSRRDPGTEYFDPIRAAILLRREGQFDEACWLIFLFTHFGKNLKSGYRLIADVYGRLGNGKKWNWAATSKDVYAFRHWLDKHIPALKSDSHAHRGFGNHRKYQSLSAWKKNGTGEAVETYVAWVKCSGGHRNLFDDAVELSDGNREVAFRFLYKKMEAVKSFGRTARFDYLSMIGKLELAQIEPDSVYFQAATGPLLGAKLLFYGSDKAQVKASLLEESANSLANALKIGKQAMEDSLCNWQKSPTVPIRFRG